jgi:hypothetical protein
VPNAEFETLPEAQEWLAKYIKRMQKSVDAVVWEVGSGGR